jgi:hypothetical protein
VQRGKFLAQIESAGFAVPAKSSRPYCKFSGMIDDGSVLDNAALQKRGDT